MLLEKTPGSPLDSKEIKPINPKGNQPWIFFGRTDAEAEAPLLWPPDAKSQLTGKGPDAGKDWRQEEKGMTEDGWMALPNQWTWVWANSKRQWRIGKPGMLQSMGLQSWTRLSDWTATSYQVRFIINIPFFLYIEYITVYLTITYSHTMPSFSHP